MSKAKDITIGVGGLGFDYRAGQIGHTIVKGSPPLRRFFEAALPRRYSCGDGCDTRYSLQRNTASIMKIGFFFLGL